MESLDYISIAREHPPHTMLSLQLPLIKYIHSTYHFRRAMSCNDREFHRMLHGIHTDRRSKIQTHLRFHNRNHRFHTWNLCIHLASLWSLVLVHRSRRTLRCNHLGTNIRTLLTQCSVKVKRNKPNKS